MDFEALYLAEKKQNAELLNEVRLLREQVEYLTKKLFSSHSEKTEAILGQLCLNLFDEVENEVNPNASEPTLETVIRKKRQKGCKEKEASRSEKKNENNQYIKVSSKYESHEKVVL